MLKWKVLTIVDGSSANVEFKGSHGWFDQLLRWGQLHGLKFPGESASADTEATEMFPGDLKKVLIEGGFYEASDSG